MTRPYRLSLWTLVRVMVAVLLAPSYGRHGAPDRVVADYEIEHGGPWRAGDQPADPAPQLEHGEIGDGAAFKAELHAMVEEVRAEQNGEKPLPPLTGELTDAEREARVAAIQGATTEVPVIDSVILLERDTQRQFDAAFKGVVEQFDDEFVAVLDALLDDDEETKAALLRIARCQRDEFAQTIEMPAVRVEVSA